MENNIQYIGARYVPKFANPIEWDKNRSYEALEIVTYLGTSYTSKIPVPAGIEISNSTYWVATGNYNAQVESLRLAVADVEKKCQRPLLRKGLKILCIGDSYGTPDLTKSWVTVLANLAESTCVNYCVAGTGIKRDSNGVTFGTQLIKASQDEDANSFDLVLIMGGANDNIYAYAELESAVISTMNSATKLFPNAMVVIGCIGSTSVKERSTQGLQIVTNVIRAYKNGTRYTPRALYLSGSENILSSFRAFTSDDGLHPIERAHDYLGHGIYNCLNGFTESVAAVGRPTVNVAPPTNPPTNKPALFSYCKVGDCTVLNSSECAMTWSSGSIVSLKEPYTLSPDISAVTDNFRPMFSFVVNARGWVRNSGTYHPADFWIGFSAETYAVTLTTRIISDNGYLLPEQVTTLSIYPWTVSIPSLLC